MDSKDNLVKIMSVLIFACGLGLLVSGTASYLLTTKATQSVSAEPFGPPKPLTRCQKGLYAGTYDVQIEETFYVATFPDLAFKDSTMRGQRRLIIEQDQDFVLFIGIMGRVVDNRVELGSSRFDDQESVLFTGALLCGSNGALTGLLTETMMDHTPTTHEPIIGTEATIVRVFSNFEEVNP